MFNFLKYQLSFITLFIPLVFNHGVDADKLNTNSDCMNYVLIQGSSNINQFEFINYDLQISQPEHIKKNQETYKNIEIPVKKFLGPNTRMLNDFFKMLKASEFPYIKINIEPREQADFDETTGLTKFKTKISIAGNTHTFVVPCQINFCKNSEMVLEGDLQIELSDFEIEPPKKLLGAVKVNDEVFITFAFKYNLKKT